MKFDRAGGILIHPTSFPSPYGIGDLGPQAYRFVDWLASSQCKLWQILPLGPTGYGDSPYQCFSAFAGNPYLISPDVLIQDGLLTQDDLRDVPAFPASRADFGLLIPWKLTLLLKAFSRFPAATKDLRDGFDYYCAQNASWLNDYALFMALKDSHGGKAWNTWEKPLRMREQSALDKARKELSNDIHRHSFYQYLFSRQWENLRKYANEKGLKIIGDMPIFVAYDSADVWSHPELFFLDETGNPTVVAGVPPDLFSPTGQLWGNPLYRWDIHKESGYAWWLERIKFALKTIDILRLDHFRGFAGYYEIPASDKTAEHGHWVPGPGSDFFRAVDSKLSDGASTAEITLPIIAEDLGLITPDVIALLEEFQLPGMKVLQFGFSDPKNPFLPHNYVENCVAYTGTHDNDTAKGWFESTTSEEREFALRYLNIQPCEGSKPSQGFAWDLIRAVWSSVATIAMTPMQDVLNLGGEARMNFPSKLGGNWEWRMSEGDLSESLANKLRELNWLYLR
ncbi:MAG: 4-alpha-glucanotransferase [Anaerolineae bacterium]|nr:4-alpha-glucanotransferase [Anaerolineae bacterium]MBL8105966.1 4-alpha-glucanotransferase [Anaerolineales bacterium]MCC7189493.1 4-alpha-glucanotransferase [Anaerolineales bacterium]